MTEEKEYFLTSNILRPFTSMKSCPLVITKNTERHAVVVVQSLANGFNMEHNMATIRYKDVEPLYVVDRQEHSLLSKGACERLILLTFPLQLRKRSP